MVMKYTSLVFAVLLSATVANAGSFSEPNIFSRVDATIKDPKTKGRKLVILRYYRILARVNVFGLYCDPGNKKGYNTLASKLYHRMSGLEKEAEKILGGMQRAYNHFENNRNEESLRFVRSDLSVTCADGLEDFKRYANMTPYQMNDLLERTPFGSL